VLTTLATAITPVLGNTVYIGGGLLGTILIILLVVWLVRRA
jgi:flagellar biogenesis protein FliO